MGAMYIIETRYIGATDKRSARVKAMRNGKSKFYEWDNSKQDDRAIHQDAARRFLETLTPLVTHNSETGHTQAWHGETVGHSTRNDAYLTVFTKVGV